VPTTTVTFNDLTNPNRPLNGQYLSGVIDWGNGAWYLSAPWRAFTTNSIGFNGAGPTAENFTFVTPHRLVQVDAYNGGPAASTITFSCTGQSTRTFTLAASTLATLTMDWSGPCTTVAVTSTNGWNTNFDNVVVE